MHFSSETGGGVVQVVTFMTIFVQGGQDQVEWGFEQPGVVEDVCPWQRGWNKMIFKVSSNLFSSKKSWRKGWAALQSITSSSMQTYVMLRNLGYPNT